MDKIKVAMILSAANDGGVEAFAMNYFTFIDREKISFDFYVEGYSKLIDKEKIEKMGGRVFIIPRYTHIFNYMKTLKKYFAENHYDIVHSNINTLSVFPLKVAKKVGIKVRIAHSHSTSNKKEILRNVIKNILRPFSKKYATHYFACSELAGRYLFGNKTFDAGKVTVINNAIDCDRFKFDIIKRNKTRKELNISDDCFVIGHVGRMVSQKNHSFILDVFFEVLKKRPNSKLLFVGDGPLKEEIILKAKELYIYDNIIIAGVHKHTERFYDAMDCFLLPSLYEGLPLSAIEAQTNLLDCVLSNKITKEIVINDNVKMISLDNSINEWCNSICLINRKERENVVDKIFGTKYDIRHEANVLLSKYEEILNENLKD